MEDMLFNVLIDIKNLLIEINNRDERRENEHKEHQKEQQKLIEAGMNLVKQTQDDVDKDREGFKPFRQDPR
jgi:hypothetical protein